MKRRPDRPIAHATEDVVDADAVLCGPTIATYEPWPGRVVARVEPLKIDNADPTCKRCLACIRARIRGTTR